ncbi:MAG TPA: peptidoglycan DD-metalloendopeptidase family protein [Pyrinomonadaceae bacterium]|jgi:murein DD-endopeptidase MepM/ murein hydrolase activator NlpD|nr:peptidoglycan DD-metalloendopeptidase family protein [Pyrinomonadaceae bacterium]
MATRLRILILLGFLTTVLAIGALIRKLNAKPAPAQAIAVNLSSPEDARHTTAPVESPATNATPLASPSPTDAPSTILVQPTPLTETIPSPAYTPSPPNSPTPVATPVAPARTGNLIIPVAGIRPDQLQDTFTTARSEGRMHDAIDIIAPKGTPVLAAVDGPIIKLFLSKPGGITIYQLGTDNRTIYYYAHLDHYADGLTEGHFARQGETIAYVGDTGNAGAGNYHLHFSISLVQNPKRYWAGVNINPYPLLKK